MKAGNFSFVSEPRDGVGVNSVLPKHCTKRDQTSGKFVTQEEIDQVCHSGSLCTKTGSPIIHIDLKTLILPRQKLILPVKKVHLNSQKHCWRGFRFFFFLNYNLPHLHRNRLINKVSPGRIKTRGQKSDFTYPYKISLSFLFKLAQLLSLRALVHKHWIKLSEKQISCVWVSRKTKIHRN